MSPPARLARAIVAQADSPTVGAVAPRFALSCASLDVTVALAAAIRRQHAALLEHGRTLDLAPTSEPCSVRADAVRLDQILDTLIGNASRFSRTRVTVGAAHGKSKDGEVCFRVTDDGPGIHPEELPHVLDRFWHVPPTDRSGAGLGLWFAQELVTTHGGRIGVESTRGVGTTFWFTLPAVDATEP